MPVTAIIFVKYLPGKESSYQFDFGGGKMHCCMQVLLGTVREGAVKENFRTDSVPVLGLPYGIVSQICL